MSLDVFDGPEFNPILLIAQSLLGQTESVESLIARSYQQIKSELSSSDVESAMRHVIVSRLPPELTNLVARFAAHYALEQGNRRQAAEYHDFAADYLDSYDDVAALTNAAWHYKQARSLSVGSDPERQVNEAWVHARLASCGINQSEHLDQAASLCDAVLSECDASSQEWCIAHLVLASVLLERAIFGIDSLANVNASIDLCDDVGCRVPAGSPGSYHAILTKARGLYLRGNFGGTTIASYQEALQACDIAHEFFTPESDLRNYLMLSGVERATCLSLAELGYDPRQNVERVLKLADEAESLCGADQFWLSGIWLDSAIALKHLGEWNTSESRNTIDRGVQLARKVQTITDHENINYPSSLLCEANLYLLLASREVLTQKQLEMALDRLREAKNWTMDRPTLEIRIAVTDATVRKQLAEHGATPMDHLRSSIENCHRAERFVAGSNTYRQLLAVTRAAAHIRLADFGVDAVVNLQMAVELYDSVNSGRTTTDVSVVKARLDATTAFRKLAILGINDQANLKRALFECRSIIETLQIPARANPVLAELLRQAFAEMANACASAASKLTADSVTDLQAAIYYLGEAREMLSEQTEELAHLSLNEAVFHLMLAKIGPKSSQSCERAKQLAEDAAEFFDQNSHKGATCQSVLAEVALLTANPTVAYERLAAALEGFESTRRQVQSECDRIAFGQMLFDRYERIVKTCLDVADSDSTYRSDWTMKAWHWVHRAKGRTFLELLEGSRQFALIADEVSHVQSPDKVLISLREMVRNDPERTLYIEFFALSTTELAIFYVPLRSGKGVEVVRTAVKSEFVEEVCLRVLRQGENYDPAGDTLIDLPDQLSVFFEPLAGEIQKENPQALLISPHFFLNVLPLHAAQIGGKPLIEQFTVSYLPSPTLAHHFASEDRTAGTNAILVGDPKGDLHWTAVEVEKIAGTLAKSGISTKTLVGREATATAMQAKLKNAAIVHIASHAVLEQDFSKSGVELADGRVLPDEIMSSWDLSQTSLAFLSTCVSGLSITGPSDDFMAIARVFFYSGASTVIANLWSASQAAGECFANNFYKFWISDSLPLPEAFQKATLATRETFPQPLHWASFTAIGVPNPPHPRAASS